MKKQLLILLLLGLSKWTFAQNTFPVPSGSVGIGTTSPQKILEVNTPDNTFISVGTTLGYGNFAGIHFGFTEAGNSYYRKSAIVFQRDDAWARGKIHILNNSYGNYTSASLSDAKLTIDSEGKVGIGTTSPVSKVQVEGDGSAQMRFIRTGVPGVYGFEQGGSTFGLYDYTNAVYRLRSSNNDVLLNEVSGNVIIGKSTQANSLYKLDVNGAVRANEVRVNTTGADFVFANDYKLRSLNETEKFIKEHKHLPEIASAEDMEKEGVDVGALNTKLLQKIEELTLHLIELNKTVQRQQVKIETLESKR